ncbi:MAG: SPOR domain-containing protein [Vicingaceae bacterium]|nr:SPOR domain-containing protein [Vicingaceae bacterium]
MKILLASLFTLFTCQSIFCQAKSDSLQKKTTVIKDSRIDILGETYKATYTLKGYRVQIHSGNKRQPANQTRASFLRVHPKTKAHLDYEQPYYKVRVGDFKTKMEALKYKKFISKEFPNSFIVSDDIEINELSK